MRTYTIDNIEFSFREQGHDAVGDDENLGVADLLIPGPMMQRFAKECGIKEGRFYVLPHYDPYDYRVGKDNNRPCLDSHAVLADGSSYSAHACYNADTQIVLMNYLFEKRRKYKLMYKGLDPYWLFHDSRHAINDVYGYTVDGINSWTEAQRLMEGAELAKKSNVYMQIQTVVNLLEAWDNRWKYIEDRNYEKLDFKEVRKFVHEDDLEELEFKLSL